MQTSPYVRAGLRGLGDSALLPTTADGVCPAGYNKSCLVHAPGAPLQCNCLLQKQETAFTAVSTAATSTVTTVNHHWGLLAAGVLGVFVIYKLVL